VLKCILSLSQLVIIKLIGIKIVWTAHNLKNHENRYPKLDKFFTDSVVRLADSIITHTEVAKDKVAEKLEIENREKILVVPHGNYIGCYENNIDSLAARKILDLPDTSIVLMFIGAIRPYKGVVELIEAFNQLQHEGAKLVIVGKPNNEKFSELICQKIDSNQNIKFIPEFVENDQIQIYMNACDAVVLPYRSILTSGSVLLAMSFGKACIAPLQGCIAEVLDEAGAFLYDSNNKDSLLEGINRAIETKDKLAEMGRYNLTLAKKWNWNYISELTLNLYMSCFKSAK
jgi:glycosyltransferase involved in cell wall biosynthesis